MVGRGGREGVEVGGGGGRGEVGWGGVRDEWIMMCMS